MENLLLTKAKMLQYHCPECLSPLFEKEDKIICPKCGVLRWEGKENIKKEHSKQQRPETRTWHKKSLKVVRKKRDELLERLEQETDPDKIVTLTEAVKKMDNILGAEEDEDR